MYLIIFDVDGTLVDSQDTILRGLAAGYEAVGLEMPERRQALSIVGLSLERAFLTLVGENHADKVADMSAAYRKCQIERREKGLDQDPLYPGAIDNLLALHQRDDVLLGIATGKARRGVDHLLKKHDLEGKFVTIQTADTSPSKPHPDMVQKALAETGASVERTVLIGDTSFDMEMARAGGVHALGVTWGYHDASLLLESGAHMVIDGFGELPDALGRLFQENEEVA